MALKYGYYNSVSGDRAYNADDMSAYFKGLFTRGVVKGYASGMRANASSGMTVTIPTGKIFFSDGHWCEVTTDESVTLFAAETVQNRIDRIVIRNDKRLGVRGCVIAVLTGTPATNPTAPALTISEDVEEMSLCQVYISNGVTAVVDANIIDERGDITVCGYCYALGQEVDAIQTQLDGKASKTELQTAQQTSANNLSNVYNSLVYKKGDTIRVDRIMAAGCLTGSAATIGCFIPLPKPIVSGDTVSVANPSDCTITVRHADGGYLLQNTTFKSLKSMGGDIVWMVYENGVEFQYTDTASWSATNNIPVEVTITGLELTLN